MRRLLTSFVILGLMAGSVATAEAKRKRSKPPKQEPARVERTVEGGYDGPYVPLLFSYCHQTDAWGCISIPTRPNEAFLTSAKVTDAHGLPIQVSVYADTSEWPGGDLDLGSFCGETTEAISFPARVDLSFSVGPVWPGEARASCPAGSAATTGRISVTLSNLPSDGEPVRSVPIVEVDGRRPANS